jgi:hypothetical protein
MTYKFNLNNIIKVKLSDAGFCLWKDKEDEVYLPYKSMHKYMQSIEDYKKKADGNGYVDFQAWHFIELFGGTIKFGSNPIFDTNILIDEVYLSLNSEQSAEVSDTSKAQ